jgi:hypothetical protein
VWPEPRRDPRSELAINGNWQTRTGGGRFGWNGVVRLRQLGWVLTVAVGLGVGLATPALASTVPSTTYPDGLVVSVASLETMPSADAATCSNDGICRAGETPGDVLVRVTVRLSLPDDAPAGLHLDVVAGTASGIGLAVGERHMAAAVDCGNLAETTVLCTDNSASVPTDVVPGVDVFLCESFDVPASDRSAMDVTIQPPVSDADGANPLRTTRFTDVGGLLTG